MMAGHDKVWGPKPPQGNPPSHSPGMAAGNDSLGAAVGQLHWEHPHHVQGEGLQNKSTDKIHRHVTTSTYSGKIGGGG